MTNINDKAPAGATHRYEHAGLVSWYREVDGNMFTWRDGSWFASFFKSAQDLAQSCMLGKVTPLVADTAQQVDDDLTWLARNTHKWPDIVPGRAVAAAFVSEGSVRWLEYPPVDWDGCYRKHEWLARRAKLQNKPSWKEAPEWVRYRAQSDSGTWHWFDGEPEINEMHDSGEFWSAPGYSVITDQCGEVLGDWRDTLERRPADLSEPAVTERLTEATQNVLAAVPGLVSEKFKLELPPSQHKWVIGDAASPSTVMMDGNEQSAEQHVPGGLAVQMTNTLKKSPFYFTSNELMDIQFLIEDELTKRDAAVCGGQKYIDAHWFERGELPPVGVECEYTLSDCGIWYRCKINYVIPGEGVVMLSDAAGEQYCSLHSKQPVTFRPIRTERDVLIEIIKKTDDTDDRIADAILAAGFKRGEA